MKEFVFDYVGFVRRYVSEVTCIADGIDELISNKNSIHPGFQSEIRKAILWRGRAKIASAWLAAVGKE